MKRFRKLFYVAFVLSLLQFSQAQDKPKVYAVSNAHFDSQWNWDVQTSITDYVSKTLDQNLFLLKQYPNYIFNFEGGIKYYWMKEYYPDQYEEVKNYIKQGRWHVTGSTWDATDVNIPAPESLTRNILYGQMFYRDEFNVLGTDIFLPDCFGFGWILPTIMSHSGLIGFSTQKLQWRTNPFFDEGKKIPFEIGLWRGVDGSKIMLVADGRNYTTRWPFHDLSRDTSIIRFAEENPLKKVYHYYGTGDTGGAPSIESVMTVEEGLKGDGPVKIISATSDQLYKDYLPFDKHPELPLYNGELLMDVHGTGCYTSQAAMKLYNRKNELLGDASERFAVVADWLGGQVYPRETFADAWKRFIWHQFHDDLTGTSIPRAYEFSWNDELLSQKQFSQVLTSSVGSITRALETNVKGTPLIIQNTVSQPVKDIVEITANMPKSQSFAVYDEKGNQVPSQFLSYEDNKAKVLVAADLLPVSLAVYDIRPGNTKPSSALKITDNSIENSVYKVTLNSNGDIGSIIDKRYNKELVKSGKAIRLALFTENESFSWPAWEVIKKTIDASPVDITEGVKITVAEKGPVRAALCVERKYGESVFKQYIRLTEGGQDDRIDFVTEIDWKTSNALLKAEFPLSIENEAATYDLGIGNVERKNNTITAYEVIAQYWADLAEKDKSYGVSIMNNSKYGWDKPDNNTLRLTLLHTPKTSRGFLYQDQQDMGYHTFTYSLMGHKDSYVEGQTVLKAELLNQPPKAFIAPKHKGTLGRSISFLKTSSDQLIVKALKKAEKTDDYVVRLYETAGKEARNFEVTFAGDILEAKELNGVEDVIGNATINGNKLIVNATPFGIKTFSVKLKPATAKLTPPQSLPLPLQYNVKTATYNAFRTDANIDGKGYSYAAELLPAKLTANGISFNLGNPAIENAVRCNGDTILLPQNGQYNKLYLLAASIMGDCYATFYVDDKPYELVIPYYTGFIGQWGHINHTEGFYKPTEVAYIGTHRHQYLARENRDAPYEFTYMFKFGIDIPKNAKKLVLSNNGKVLLFAAGLAQNENDNITPATCQVTTAMTPEQLNTSLKPRKNLLKGKTIIGKSSRDESADNANRNNFFRRSQPEFAIDEDLTSQWSDFEGEGPKFIEIDMGAENTIKGWFVLQPGRMGSFNLAAKEFSLDVKKNINDPWQTVDLVKDNEESETNRLLTSPVSARYVRLTIIKGSENMRGRGQQQGNQRINGATISEFEVY